MRGASALKMDFNTTWRPDYLRVKRILEYALIGYKNMIDTILYVTLKLVYNLILNQIIKVNTYILIVIKS